MKASFLSRKLLETESLAEVQFVIDSCRFDGQSNCLNNSNKDCDWLLVACFIREQYTTDATFSRLENQVWLEIQPNAWGNYWIFFIIQQIKKPRLCSVLL